MSTAAVAVIRTGVANLASIVAGLRRARVEAAVVDDPGDVTAAQRVVLPGVGSFGAGMARLSAKKLIEPLRRRILEGRPTLAICLGLQLLCAESEESPGVCGLGLLPLRVSRFDGEVRVPQLGWNAITPDVESALVQPGYASFANSYRLVDAPAGWSAAWSDHGGPFIASIERGSVLACQFHPELSGTWGLSLLRRWIEFGAREMQPC